MISSSLRHLHFFLSLYTISFAPFPSSLLLCFHTFSHLYHALPICPSSHGNLFVHISFFL